MSSLLDVLLPGRGGVALRAGTTELSAFRLRAAVWRTARQLAGHGITADSGVLVRAAPGPDFVVFFLAALRIGAQAFVVDHRIPEGIVVDAARRIGIGYQVASALDLPATRGFSTAPTVVRGIDPIVGRRSEHLVVHLSSGTTAEPKLIGRSESDILAELEGYHDLGGIAPAGSSVVVGSALSSAWGVYGALVASLGSGLELVFPSSTTSRGLLGAVASSARSAVILGVPMHVPMIAGSREVPAQLAGIVTSGASLPATAVTRASAALDGVVVGQVYGSTEVGLIAADLHGRLPGTVGRVRPGLRTRLGPRDELEVAMSSSPYLDRRSDSGRWRSSGWLRTHDAVDIDDAGVMTVVGRLDGLVSFGGKKFHVSEVEHHLRGDEAIEDVVVFVNGARIEAFVTVAPGRTLDKVRVAGRVPEYMRPHAIKVAARIPRSFSGKVLCRRELIDQVDRP